MGQTPLHRRPDRARLRCLPWPILGGRGALVLLRVLLLVLLLHHLRNLSTLYRWLQDPSLEHVPVG